MSFQVGDKVLKKAKQSRLIGTIQTIRGNWALVEWPNGTGEMYLFDRLRKAT